jgi:rhodanese-related sulfurtransferase
MSYVTEFPVAEPQEAVAHFLRRLSVETDCADVHHALINNQQDFVLLHVVGQAGQFAQRHLPGAIHLPWAQISAEKMAEWPVGTLFVVYCAGPHCNGAAAVKSWKPCVTRASPSPLCRALPLPRAVQPTLAYR